MSDISFCKGDKEYIKVTETESKAWHDYDTYTVSCSKCGAMKTSVLARRPNQTLLRCKEKDDE